ncbi:MAG: hypothetical protein SVR08_17995 [Spirochaetota bacterium]|nr:hypothetical protein [Spirochaetota bacterium]
MKVIHIIKRIETLDYDIRDLRKLEKSIKRNKSFSTPIYMSIEKQINILLGERIRLLELTIENPPENLVEEIEGEKPKIKKPVQKQVETKTKAKKAKETKPKVDKKEEVLEDEELPMFLQDDIDQKIEKIKTAKESTENSTKNNKKDTDNDFPDDEDVKILDVALEKGTLNKNDIEKEKKRVRFFKDNFPTNENEF